MKWLSFFARQVPVVSALLIACATTLQAQIFVVNTDDGVLGEYNADGSAISADLITFASGSHPYSIQTDGTFLYVDLSTSDDLMKYSMSGMSEGTIIMGLHVPRGFVIDAGNIFVLNSSTDTLGEYTLAGAPVHTALATLTASPYKIAALKTNLFITTTSGVSEFNTLTGTINNSFITGYTGLRGIAVTASDIFVSDYADNTVKEFDLTGKLVTGTFIHTKLNEPDALTFSGNDFYIGDDGSQNVTEFTNTGVLVKSGLIENLDDPTGVLVIPEPLTSVLVGVGFASLLGLVSFRRMIG
jgi:hypothetical protein